PGIELDTVETRCIQAIEFATIDVEMQQWLARGLDILHHPVPRRVAHPLEYGAPHIELDIRFGHDRVGEPIELSARAAGPLARTRTEGRGASRHDHAPAVVAVIARVGNRLVDGG